MCGCVAPWFFDRGEIGHLALVNTALDADLAGWIQRRLQLDVGGTGTEATAVHRAEHLDVAYWDRTRSASGCAPARLRAEIGKCWAELPVDASVLFSLP
jgi:hypothetical protein